MFVVQTTIAVLAVVLALKLYEKIQNAIIRSRHQRIDVESSAVARKDSTRKHFEAAPSPPAPRAQLNEDDGQRKDLERLKTLYHKLHSLENHADILPGCRELLEGLLSETLSAALQDEAGNILSINAFSRDGLSDYLKAKDVQTTNLWEEYLVRRKSGSPREVVADRNEAIWWLKQAAPVKYVDGAWLGHINKASTPFYLRKITKNAWQVMSEELGDGELEKNHVQVYRDLMREINVDLPSPDSADFISEDLGLGQLRCWKAAVAQLLISLFPHDFLPEVLGFSMAYESLPVHLLKTVKELRELGINPYYFELHISIDNAHSGHAAMAAAVVADYIALIADREGREAAETAWRRVQAGYLLADGLPTTPESPSMKSMKTEAVKWTEEEAALVTVFAAKAPVAHKIHCNSRLRIGRRTLVDWLEPEAFADERWQKDFLQSLSLAKPWVIKGDSMKSRLVRELSWEGKMFGSFTQSEVEVVKAWIDSLGTQEDGTRSDPTAFRTFTGIQLLPAMEEKSENILSGYPCFTTIVEPPAWPALTPHEIRDLGPLGVDGRTLDFKRLAPLWFASTALLESLPSVPCRSADPFGSAVIRVLRAQAGFSDEGPGVAGMDEVRRTDDGQALGLVELGLEMCERSGLGQPQTLQEAARLGREVERQMAERMVGMSMRWLTYRERLGGMAWAFMELHELLAENEAVLGPRSQKLLKDIARRERIGLEVCKRDVETDSTMAADFWGGVALCHRAIDGCWKCV